MEPCSIPNLSFSTLATGARQLVVHEALEIIWSLAFKVSWLTPYTTVASTLVPGAEMMTFFAPASMCAWALSRLVKIPVHSYTTSTFRSPQGSLEGSRSEVKIGRAHV